MAAANYIETISHEGALEIIARIKEGRKAIGKRPPFTRKPTTQEKLARWLDYDMRGMDGWYQFLHERAAEGMPPQDCIIEMITFHNWGKRMLAKSDVMAPSMMGEM